jgi:hypothetical protein
MSGANGKGGSPEKNLRLVSIVSDSDEKAELAATARMRGSRAANSIDNVPPSELPTIAIRVGSTPSSVFASANQAARSVISCLPNEMDSPSLMSCARTDTIRAPYPCRCNIAASFSISPRMDL